jgi:arylsulfatase A-like enzyme
MNQLVAALFIAVVSIFAFAGDTASGGDRPNVLFLLTDDQRADTIAALGNAVIRTPNLDELSNRGFVFTNAYCMGSTMPAVCNPSRHRIMTGMALFRYDENQKEGTFGDVMRKAGYVTYHLSKRGNTARVPHTAFEYSRYPPIAAGLRGHGIDVTTTADAQLLSADDEDHVAFALREGRVIFTNDADFLRLHHRALRGLSRGYGVAEPRGRCDQRFVTSACAAQQERSSPELTQWRRAMLR